MGGKKGKEIVRVDLPVDMSRQVLHPLDGEYLPHKVEGKVEPIPHNDEKAIADAVNELREKLLDERLSILEAKVDKLLSVWDGEVEDAPEH